MFYRLLPGAEKLKPQDEDVENDSGESNNYSGRPSQLSNIFTLLAQIYTPLTTTFACILLLLNLNQWRQPRADWDSRVVGHMGQIETVFSGSEEWESLDPQYDLLWEQYTSGAELMVEDTEVEQEDKIPASISMIHQLHCLGAMRKALRDARPLDDKEAGHLSHCLDYVRMVSEARPLPEFILFVALTMSLYILGYYMLRGQHGRGATRRERSQGAFHRRQKDSPSVQERCTYS